MRKIKSVSFIIFLAIIPVIFSSCDFHKERDQKIVDLLNWNSTIILDQVFTDLIYIKENVQDRGYKKSEVHLLEKIDSIIVFVNSFNQTLGSGGKVSLHEIEGLKLELTEFNDFYNKAIGKKYSSKKVFSFDSTLLNTGTSNVKNAMFRNELMHELKKLTDQGKGLVGSCGFYFGPSYKAEFSVLKNGINEVILYSELPIPYGGDTEVSNVKFNGKPLEVNVLKIGQCFYLRFNTSIKENNTLSFDLETSYKGDSLFFKEVTLILQNEFQ